MNRVLYIILAIILATCNAPGKHNETNNNSDPHNTPPLYTISDLIKKGLKGNIKAITYSNYQSVEMLNNQWKNAVDNDQEGNFSVEYYNTEAFITAVHSEINYKYEQYKSYGDDTNYYANGILTNTKHYARYEDVNSKGKRELLSTISYYWITPLSYKTRKYMSKNNICDTGVYIMAEIGYNKDYKVEMLTYYSQKDSTKTDNKVTYEYNEQYNTKTTKSNDGKTIATDVVQQKDEKGNPIRILHIEDKKNYTYTISYEYYQ